MSRERFHRVLGTALTISLALASRAAAGGLPVPILKEVKAATVFIKVGAAGPGLRLGGSGSGFLFLVKENMAFVATNHHVVAPPAGAKALGPPTLVFFSGTSKEHIVDNAEVVASDSSRDLAVLRFKAFDDMPKPIVMPAKIELVETMSVFSFGFPFGERLSPTKRNPAITVGRASISSLREDEFGRIKMIQIDGDLNPGNSGGPVVDEKGRLVGVAVAKIRETRIGMAIPPEHLAGMLEGRVGSLGARVKNIADGKAQVEFTAALIDPLSKIKAVSVRVAMGAGSRPLKIAKDGTWSELPESQSVTLSIKGGQARGSFAVAEPSHRTKRPGAARGPVRIPEACGPSS